MQFAGREKRRRQTGQKPFSRQGERGVGTQIVATKEKDLQETVARAGRKKKGVSAMYRESKERRGEGRKRRNNPLIRPQRKRERKTTDWPMRSQVKKKEEGGGSALIRPRERDRKR